MDIERHEGTNPPLLEIEHLKKYFATDQGWIRSLFMSSQPVRAVDDVSFSLQKGEILSIVGESGCGKSTLGKTLVRLLEPSAGTIRYQGRDITNVSGSELQELRRSIQIIFQDPFSSLNPRKSVSQLVEQPLNIHDIGDDAQRRQQVETALEDVGLTPVSDYLDRYPDEMSGGQMQRVAFARALVLEPDLVIADEPTSMLDASIQARILGLIDDLRFERDLSFLIITHDFSIARYLSDRIGVMYLGRLMELGGADEVISNPQHPYSQALIQSIPVPNPHQEFTPADIAGDVPDPKNIPSGCRFHPRCPMKEDHCESVVPEWRTVSPDESDGSRAIACHEIEPKVVPDS